MNKLKITNFELTTLSFFLFNSFLFTTGIHLLVKQNNTDSIFSILMGIVVLILLFHLCKAIYHFHQKQDILNKIELLFPKTKQLFYITIFIFLFTTLIYIIRRISTYINYYILKDTELIVIIIPLLLTCFYIGKKKLPSITKLSEICFYLYFFLLLVVFLGIFPYLNLENIKPLLTSSLQDNIRSSFFYFSSLILPFFLIGMIPKAEIQEKKKYNRSLLRSIQYSGLICFFHLFTTLSILGVHLTKIYLYPEMIIYKKISFLNVLERLETILSFIQILNSLFLILLCIYCLNYVLKKIIPISQKKENISYSLLLVLLTISVALLTIPHYLFLIGNGIFFLLLLIIRLRIYVVQRYPTLSKSETIC